MTIAEALRASTEFLERKGVDSPRLDAELLLAKGLGVSRLELYAQHDRPLSEAEPVRDEVLGVDARARDALSGQVVGGRS